MSTPPLTAPRIVLEYATSGRSKCREFRCKGTIAAGELRAYYKQRGVGGEGQEALPYGPGFYCMKPQNGYNKAPCILRPFQYKNNKATGGIVHPGKRNQWRSA